MDDIDCDDDGCRGGSRSGDDGIEVQADANIVIIVVDKDHGGRGRRHAAWIDNDGGGETKPAVIVNGKTYRVVKLRRGAVVPRRQSSSLSSSYHPLECTYWLRSKLCGTIYGCIQWGTVLRLLDQPVHVSVDVKESAVVKAGWMSTSVHVAIKEMSWELVGEHRSMLAENPIKEVTVMQYLKAFVGDKRRRRRRRWGEEGQRGLPQSWTWRGGRVRSRPPTQCPPRWPALSPWPRPPKSDGCGDE